VNHQHEHTEHYFMLIVPRLTA